jgi:hypothetical protein
LQLLTTPLDADFQTEYQASAGGAAAASSEKASKFLAHPTEHEKADAYFGSRPTKAALAAALAVERDAAKFFGGGAPL